MLAGRHCEPYGKLGPSMVARFPFGSVFVPIRGSQMRERNVSVDVLDCVYGFVLGSR